MLLMCRHHLFGMHFGGVLYSCYDLVHLLVRICFDKNLHETCASFILDLAYEFVSMFMKVCTFPTNIRYFG